jgi:hypothetical protein
MENQPITISKLYPNLPIAELQAAEENLTAYLGLIVRIYTRLEHEGRLEVLTEINLEHRFRAKVDSKQP